MQQGVRSWKRIGPAVAGCLVAIALLGACSSGDDDDTSGGSTTTAGGEGSSTTEGGDNPFGGSGDGGSDGGGAAQTDPESLTGVWEGTYTCGQGETELRLTIDDRGDGGVGGAFQFTTPGAGGTEGSYSMVGNRDGGTLTLDPHEWLQEVRNYRMVGLRAEIADRSDTEALSGTVEGDGCTEFTAERTSAEPWYAGEWRGKYGCSQGITGITLTVESQGGADVAATFEFYAVPENPGVPSGSYRMAGTYENGRLLLEGVEWIEQPPGYGMVGYESNTDLGIDPNRIFGTVTGAASCNVFEMRRQG